MKRLVAYIIMTAAAGSMPVSGGTYHINPATGNGSNPGTAALPWRTLEDAAGHAFASGDTVLLYSGYHGRPVINGTYDVPLVIRAVPGNVPQLKSLQLGGRSIVIDGVTITPDAVTPYQNVGNLVTFAPGASFMTVRNCSLYSRRDASRWTTANYRTEACHAFFFNTGRGHVISNNVITNVQNAVPVGPGVDSVLVEYNTITHFWEDALRGCGDYGVYQCNLIKNAHKGAYHEDAFQAYATPWDGSASVKGCIVRNNTVINQDDPDLAYPAPLQGISCFDGYTDGWRIENNLVAVNAYHGISLYGAVNCTIINNTVIPIAGNTIGDRTWIGLFPHKQCGSVGIKSTGNLIRNNLCRELFFDDAALPVLPENAYAADHNIASPFYKVFLMDYAGGDYSLKPDVPAYGGLPAIDGGTAEMAPATDILDSSRPKGGGVDVGCYEYDPAAGAGRTGYRPTGSDGCRTAVAPQPLTGTGFLRIVLTEQAPVDVRIRSAVDGSMVSASFAGTDAAAYDIGLDRMRFETGMYVYTVSVGGTIAGKGRFVVE